MFDARQVLRKDLAAGAGTRCAYGLRLGRSQRLGLFPGQFNFGCSQIAGQGILEQVAFLGGEGFASGAKAHPAQVGQLKREGLDLDLCGVKFGVAVGDLPSGFGGFFLRLIDEFLNAAGDPVRQFRSSVQSGQFSVQIHAGIVPARKAQSPMNRSFQR